MAKQIAIEPAASTAVATRSTASQVLAVSTKANLDDNRGKEAIDKSKVRLPRIAIAQKTSPQLEENKPEYLADIKMFDMFNSMSGDIYGRGPIEFVVLTERKRAMEFDADNKVVDFDVPWNDERCEFTEDADGTRVKPQATRFYEFVVMLVESGELAVLSFSKTSTKAAEDLEAYQTMRKGPAWAGRYRVSTFSKAYGKNTVGIFKVLPAGPTPDDLYESAEALYEFVKASQPETDTAGLTGDEGSAPASRQPGDEDVPY